jgi:hypothetical protein
VELDGEKPEEVKDAVLSILSQSYYTVVGGEVVPAMVKREPAPEK